MGRKKNELVWQHFQKFGKGVLCLFCKKDYKFANVNKMSSHLLSCYKCPYEIKKKLQKEGQDSGKEYGAGASSSGSDSSRSPSPLSTFTSGISKFVDRISDEDNVSIFNNICM